MRPRTTQQNAQATTQQAVRAELGPCLSELTAKYFSAQDSMSTHLPGFIVLALASKAAASPGHKPVANLLPLVAASVTLSP